MTTTRPDAELGNGELLTLRSTLVEAAGDGGETMRVLLAPWGLVESSSGTFVLDGESAELVVRAFEAQGVDLPVDYEHQTLGGEFASPSGQAPAAGWIRRLEVVAREGLYGHVAWTPGAAERLAAREYRYVSPVALVRKRDRKLTALHSAALTNKPAIIGMRPIVNRQDLHRAKETPVMEDKLDALRDALVLEESAGAEAVLVAATERIEMLTADLARRRAEELVGRAMQAGKLTESQREWATALAMKDHGAFEAWEAAAPVVVATGRTEPPDDAADHDRSERVVVAKARHEFRSHPELELITSEQAYVDDALREARSQLAPCA